MRQSLDSLKVEDADGRSRSERGIILAPRKPYNCLFVHHFEVYLHYDLVLIRMHLWECKPAQIPTTFQRTEHGLRTDSLTGRKRTYTDLRRTAAPHIHGLGTDWERTSGRGYPPAAGCPRSGCPSRGATDQPRTINPEITQSPSTLNRRPTPHDHCVARPSASRDIPAQSPPAQPHPIFPPPPTPHQQSQP